MKPVRHGQVEVDEERRLHRGPVFELWLQRLRLPSGRRQELELILHPGAVAISARDDAGRMLVVRQYRAAAGDWLLELPAGRLEEGERAQEAARRELAEETGLAAASLELVHQFLPAPGFCSEVIHLFEARGLSPARAGEHAPDEDEEIAVLWLPPAELLAARPADGKTLVAALLALRADG